MQALPQIRDTFKGSSQQPVKFAEAQLLYVKGILFFFAFIFLVRRRNNEKTSRFQQAFYLLQECLVILDVLDSLEANDNVKALRLRNWNVGDGTLDELKIGS